MYKKNGIIERIILLHHVASNFRKSGKPFKTQAQSPSHIYYISKGINNIIKATKLASKTNNCHIVIDSFRNSLEANFFKERYTAFYLVAVHSEMRRKRLELQHDPSDLNIINKILEIDNQEYQCNDFNKGQFQYPDAQNCI